LLNLAATTPSTITSNRELPRSYLKPLRVVIYPQPQGGT
jgi:hypothetical protein